MPKKDDLDFLGVTAGAMQAPDVRRAPWFGAVAVAALVGGGWLLATRPPDAPVAPSPAFSEDDAAKRRATALVEAFLPAYYGFSYAQYDACVARAESMMTPEFQAAYNDAAENLEFKRKLSALKVVTDGIRILPDSFAFSFQGDRTLVRLSGAMTFTTGINGATGDFPLSLLITLRQVGSQLLVDDVERLR